MAFDQVRHQIVLFGGVGTGFLNDTWESNGTSWSQLLPTHRPAAREMAGFIWDPVRHLTVLFGGTGAGGVAMNDTWEWNGTDWIQLHPAHSPSPRAPSAIAFDEGRGKVVVFGVQSKSNNVDDTWLWDGNDWSRLSGSAPAANVSYYATVGMAWDPGAKSVMLVDFRGSGTNGTGLNYWLLGGSGWGPMKSGQRGMWGDANLTAFDPGRDFWLFYGSQSGMASYATVEFDGVNLVGVGTSTGIHPSAQGSSLAATYDPDMKEIVVFGGNGPQGPSSELWTWDFKGWTPLAR
jgi:Galactose oxidase, central domain